MRIIKENSPEAVQIEQLIDVHGLQQVLIAIGAICYGKSSHIAENWQDSLLARQWLKAGNAIERVSENGSIDRISR